ncbi:hypothetical protein D9611_012523 [Ephemerocybe angulata]|uniref:Uncharacterized protein n=2 Tax=Ephemerocybe angulata TaxID=980116 RepID=A0A8H6IAP6_9AGAR|nr:hypothetical protein D9611_012523 [Tulosesus angulatus]KAF6761649.1 hypothetical protein DFP72DRAFT_1061865 [Tulosesus angulatus]
MRSSALLAVVVFGAAVAVSATSHKSCPLDGLEIEGLPSSIPPSQLPLSFVSAAIGTQNYTCSPSNNYTLVGAVAELYDISCLGKSTLFTSVQDWLFGMWVDAPADLTSQALVSSYTLTRGSAVLGDHYFVPNPSGKPGNSPKWDFTSTGAFKGNKDAFVTVEKFAGSAAPTGPEDIDWVATNGIDGSLSAQVYRTDTREGQPPSSCQHGSSPDIQVKYGSKYWFYGSKLQH